MHKTKDLQKKKHKRNSSVNSRVTKKRHKFFEILFSHFPIFLPTKQNLNHNNQRQITCLKS